MWGWTVGLFLLTFALGIVAVLAGVGGGVIFVPVLAAIAPFHLDFVRGAGLFVALSGAIAAGPRLLGQGVASLRLGLPVSLITSVSAIVGATVGLTIPVKIVHRILGIAILCVLAIMFTARKIEFPHVARADTLAAALKLSGIYHEASQGGDISWRIHRTVHGLAAFVVVGFMAGLLGLGAGWANVPVLNLIMGAPLKVAVATSLFVLSITDTAAAWIYVNSGAILPVLAVPSVAGMMLGSMLGARLLTKTRPAVVRYLVLIMLLVAGVRALVQGFGGT